MIYVCVDTNIYISILLNHDEYEDKIEDKIYGEVIDDKCMINNENKYCYSNKLPKSIIDLAVLCNNNIVKLIVPEITFLELEKANKIIKQDYHSNYDKLRKSIQDQDIWNEIRNIKNDLVGIINKNENMNIKNWEVGYYNLISFLEDKNNIKSDITPELICELYRATISGKIKERQSNDYLFIRSMYKAVDIKKEDIIILVTNDKKDFYTSEIDVVEGNKVHRLKNYFIKDSVDVIGFEHIKSLYKYINSDVDIEPKIDKIIEVYKSKGLINKNEDLREEVLTNSDSRKEILDEFKMLDKSISLIKKKRIDCIKEVKDILNQCRSISSWDNRSELKLSLCLKEYSESEIDLLTLSDILEIKDSLSEYYKRHIDMLND